MPSLKVACERMRYWCEEANLGYDQNQRWNIYPGGETDCSALVIHCLREGGFDTGDASYTGNMAEELCSRGWTRLPADISTCKPGDILLNERHHTCLVIAGNGWDAEIGQASIDENGNARGGASGDQSGRETNTGSVYEYWAGWDCILRWERPTDDDELQPEKREKVQFVYNGGGDMYRLYNPNSGMHHYTLSDGERAALIEAGWNDEGVAWRAPKSAEIAVYRMYNPNNGDHYYSQSFNECAGLQDSGWIYEGVPWFSKPDGDSVYCLYNPNSGEHFYTASQSERDSLASQGWRDQGEYFRF